MNVVIVTGDKDLFQLVCDSVKVYNPKDNGTWYDAAEVQKKFGVKPSQVVDVLALMGDASDNITTCIFTAVSNTKPQLTCIEIDHRGHFIGSYDKML